VTTQVPQSLSSAVRGCQWRIDRLADVAKLFSWLSRAFQCYRADVVLKRQAEGGNRAVRETITTSELQDFLVVVLMLYS
jgi:hypothetical protein